MPLVIDSSRVFWSPMELADLIQAVLAASPNDEATWVEWRRGSPGWTPPGRRCGRSPRRPGLDVHRPGRAGPGPAGRPGPAAGGETPAAGGHLVNATAASAAEANNCRRADLAVIHPRCCHSRPASESPAITTSPNGMQR